MGKNTAPAKFKKDLIADYAKMADISKVEAEKRVEDVFGIIVDYLVSGVDVKLNNFFNFFNKVRGAKEGVNPKTNEPMVIPETKTVLGRMTKPLKDRIQGKR